VYKKNLYIIFLAWIFIDFHFRWREVLIECGNGGSSEDEKISN
jgi:hypothetical protein